MQTGNLCPPSKFWTEGCSFHNATLSRQHGMPCPNILDFLEEKNKNKDLHK